MKRKQGLKLQVSFKENIRDLEIYNFLLEEIKGEGGSSVYIKMLIAEDMKKRNKKELYKQSPVKLIQKESFELYELNQLKRTNRKMAYKNTSDKKIMRI